MIPSARSSRPMIVASIMASMFMVAIEATIVATAMPEIIAQLGGLNIYSWVFSSFLLTQTAMTVVFGKLADLYGRKPVMLIGIGIFLVSSLLAGFAWSMPSMIVFRLLQGIGAGAIQPIAMTIIADLYPARERGKVQGYLASVWAFSAIVGPLAGSLIVHNVSWAWVFWINIPVGIAAAAGFILFLKESVEVKERSIDFNGAILFTVAVAALMFALTEGGDGRTTEALVATLIFVACIGLFILQERRAPDPMISFDLWRKRPIAAANAATLCAAMSLMGLTTFLPMYVQGVLQRSSVVAGLTLTMMIVGWPAGATIAAKAFPIIGIRRMMLIGSGFLPAGAVLFVFLTTESSPILAGVGSLLMGLGMGLLSVSCLVLIQEIVDWSQRGSATASNLFARNLGSTLGATLLGAILNAGLGIGSRNAPVTSDQLRDLLQAAPGAITGDVSTRAALQHALHLTFMGMFVITLLIFFMVFMVPNEPAARKPAAE